jgi:hydrogenase-1 operon protein HyaF
MNSIYLPIIGQGSQPQEEDGAELAFMPLPSSMTTYVMPQLPPDLDVKAMTRAKALLQAVLDALKNYQSGQNFSFNTQGLDEKELAFINEILGDGEVSIIQQGESPNHIQESVLAGELLNDAIEIGDIPHLIKETTFNGAAKQLHFDSAALPDGLMNALPLVAELNAQITTFQPDTLAHVINLSLLPQTEQDLQFLYQLLGGGTVSILSRSYGTNRITSTSTDKVWWVQYFNSDDTLILNTLEVSIVPSVACAAMEDIADSATRLEEILDCIR